MAETMTEVATHKRCLHGQHIEPQVEHRVGTAAFWKWAAICAGVGAVALTAAIIGGSLALLAMWQ